MKPETVMRQVQADTAERWYVVPNYRKPGATVTNRVGELVATFEDIAEAELCVARVNGRD